MAKMSAVGGGTSTMLEKVTRCKSDTSTLLEMHRRRDKSWRWRRDSSKDSACTMPVLSLRNS